jgi:polar amino acid transport system substrate-binding protein
MVWQHAKGIVASCLWKVCYPETTMYPMLRARISTAAFATPVLLACGLFTTTCSQRSPITAVEQLGGKQVAVPTGTVADKLVSSKYPDAKFLYFNSVLDAAMAVKAGKADAAAYDEPILRNIAGKNPGLTVLPTPITVDDYGFAVRLGDQALKDAIDGVVRDARTDGTYQQMLNRWLPKQGDPGPMPSLPAGDGSAGVLRFGTAPVTEPFSFVDGTRSVTGLDVELGKRVAARLNKRIELVSLDFGAMIPALMASKVDMIGACITITEERKKSVLFSDPYYKGGISALVRQ